MPTSTLYLFQQLPHACKPKAMCSLRIPSFHCNFFPIKYPASLSKIPVEMPRNTYCFLEFRLLMHGLAKRGWDGGGGK